MRLFRNFIPLLAVAGLLISGCIAEEGKPDEKKDSVELTGFQESIYLSYDGSETASFKVVSGMTWSVTKSAGSEWLTISPANGGANIFRAQLKEALASKTAPWTFSMVRFFTCRGEG